MGTYFKITNKINAWLLIVCMMATLCVVSQPVAADTNIIDVEFEDMDLSSPVLKEGSEGAVGAVYLYESVIEKSGITVDATVEIIAKSSTSSSLKLYSFDAEGDGQNPNRFEPIVNTPTGGGYFTFRFSFWDHNKPDTPVYLHGFALTAVDIDGNMETVEISGYASYEVDASTQLTVEHSGDGYTKFKAISGNLSGVQFDNTAAFIAYYTSPITTMDVVLGNTSQATGSNRQYSLNFGNVVNAFSNAVVTPNPNKPKITVEINDESDVLDNRYADLTIVSISGSTDAGTNQTVLITVTDGTNTVSSEAIVKSDGTYLATMDLSSLNPGTITATANVVNTGGTPADTASDTSTVALYYNVTFVDYDDSELKPSQSVQYGEAAVPPADPSRTGYTFTGWDKTFDSVTGDLIVKATYVTAGYTVTFEDFDGSELKTESVNHGGSATAPADPTRTGYTFTGWDTTFDDITGDLVVTAQYTINSYNVVFKDYDGSELKTESVNYGSSATAPADPTRTGYTFTGWDKAFDDVTGDLVVTAQYTISSYDVVFKDYDGSELKTEAVNHGGSATAPADPTRTGYTFTGWDKAFDDITGDLVVTAQYSKNTYTVTYDKNGGDTEATPGTQVVGYNDPVVTLPAPPTKDGYTFTGWNTNADGSGTAFDTETKVTDNTTVYAQYTINSYDVVFKDYDGSELKAESVNHGGYATAPADPTRTGYTFTGWDKAFDDITGDLVVTAQYSKNTYTVTYDKNGGDTEATPGTQVVGYNDPVVTLPAPPTKDGYTFTGWNTNADGSGTAFDTETKVTDNTTVYAQYTINSYDVVFKDYDGSELKAESVNHGDSATAPADPIRTGYTFTGWDKAFNNITGDLVVTAKYTINSYDVVFKDHDGSEIKTESVNYGSSATAPADPIRTGYTFTGWDKAFNNITGDLVVTAQYTINSYDVVFKDHDGREIKTETVNHGSSATAPADPTRTGYTFTGWDKAFDDITGDLVVTAQYTINSYDVVFKDYDGSELKTEAVNYGGSATAPADPTRTGYTFTGWDKTFDNITGDLVVTAKYTINSYTVTYDKNGGDTEATPGTQVVGYNDPVVTLPAPPTKDGYTFTGWNTNADGSGTAFDTETKVTDNTTVYAQYTINSYNVVFKDYDGSEIKTQSVNYGSSATAPADPTRTGYTFTGWDKTFDNITGDLVVMAKYTINNYDVVFKDHDGREIKTETVNHGSSATAPADPTRTGYTFTGWDKTFDDVTGDLVVTAQYSKNIYTVTYDKNGGDTEATPGTQVVGYNDPVVTLPAPPTKDGYTFTGWNTNADGSGTAFDTTIKVTDNTTVYAQYTINSYDVVFKDHDGSEIKTESVNYGSSATAPADPIRTGYTFTGWDKAFNNITGDLIVTAQYTINSYDVVFKDHAGREIKTESVNYRSSATAPADPTRTGYTFTGWDTTFDYITGDLVVTAQYTINSYDVVFKDYDGRELKTESVNHGSAATAPVDPTRPGYTFTGWDKTFDNITGDLVVTAKYTINSYDVVFKDHDGSEIKTETVNHGSSATAPVDPTRTGYTFTGWDKTFDNITGNLVVTAKYIINSYDVVFKDHDGREIKTESVDYSSSATAPADPTRTGYTFTGWDKTFDNITGNLVVTAQYTINSYDVVFKDHDGRELKTESVNYSSSATAPADPTRPGYTFTGWDKTFDNITGNLVVTAQYSKDKYILHGVITDKNTSELIDGAVVKLTDKTNGTVLGSFTTGSDGAYAFNDLIEGTYDIHVTHNSYSDNQRQITFDYDDVIDGKIREDFKLAKYIITLTADPEIIIANGKDETLFTATVTDEDGNPIEGVEVVFDADSTLGSFYNGNKAVTDSEGKASVQYKSVAVGGNKSVSFPVTATVADEVREIYDSGEITLTFAPGRVQGIIKDSSNNPVAGAKVVIRHYDEDGNVDFTCTIVTGEDGMYSTPIPIGDEVYDVEVTTTSVVNGETVERTYSQKVHSGVVTGEGTEVFDSEKTIAGFIGAISTDGKKKLLDNNDGKLSIKVLDSQGAEVGGVVAQVNDDGIFMVTGVEKDTEYYLALIYTFEDGRQIITGRIKASVGVDGELNLNEILIDPYGTITDSETGDVISGAEVKLYYYNDNKLVELPEVVDFEPSNNSNPQISSEEGKYAYLVFPNTDYYIVATKPGYETYKSPKISVLDEIVNHDFQMVDISSYNNAGGESTIKVSNREVDFANTIQSEKNRINYLESSTFTINYTNKLGHTAENVYLSVSIPDGLEFVKGSNGAVVEDNKVIWNLGTLQATQKGSLTLVLKNVKDKEGEEVVKLTSNIYSTKEKNIINLDDDESGLSILLYSDAYAISHKRYIKGYPDNTVRPEQNITRAEIAAVFARILELEGTASNSSLYQDVDANMWAAEYIATATEKGLFVGSGDMFFNPDAPITRAELATVIARYFRVTTSNQIEESDLNFNDIQDHWAKGYIEEMYRYGIIKGYSDSSFRPDIPISRAEAITMINRMLYRGPLTNVEPSFPDLTEEHWAFGDMEESIRTHTSERNDDGSETMIDYIEEPLW